MNDHSADIPTKQLIDPWVLLRPVAKSSVEYLEMRSSLERVGFLNSVAVRPHPKRDGFYEVIDGMWRVTCAREIDLPIIPTIVKYGISDYDVLSMQVAANAIRPETKPVEFARQLKRIQKEHPQITMAEISVMVSKSPGWVRKRLGLLRLEKNIQLAIDRGEIPLGNAYMISMIPPRLRQDYVDMAKTMPTPAFKALAASVIKQFKEAVKQGKMEAFLEGNFKPQPYLRPLKEILTEVDSKEAAPFVLVKASCKTSMDGWVAALHWALHLDEHSVEEQENKARAHSRKKWKGD